VAEQFQCEQATVWRACHRYQTEGVVGAHANGRKEDSRRHATIPPVERPHIVELACWESLAQGLHITHWSSECVSTGHRLVTWAQESPCSEDAKGQDRGRFQTCFSEAPTHQTVNREKREETCPRRVVAGELALRDETCFGKRVRRPEIFVERVRILGLHTNEDVTRQSQTLVRSPGIVRRQDNETGDIEAGRRAR
jgi:hypothetical protein